MKRTRFTETQIIAILNEADAGMPVKEVCRKHGISDATYYNWKSKYGGMSASEPRAYSNTRGDPPVAAASAPIAHRAHPHPEPDRLF